MLRNIDPDLLVALRERDPQASELIDTLLDNHKQIISTISHEIRNPLSLVYSSLQMISDKYPETKNFKFWDATIEDVEFMKQLLEELSSFNNSNVLNCTSFDSTTFFRKVILSYAISVEESDIELISDIPSDLPPIYGDTNKLREVFLNLLRNASDAVGLAGTISFSVDFDYTTPTPHLIITTTDSGCGIPTEYLTSIFEMFKTYKQGGTGLGLAISKNIIEAHGGSISVMSELGKGTTFVISLPIQQNCE
ncbi:MAG: HAMP domain-containing sensor histidine kinase [Eubacteriales bacterium]